MPIKEQKIIDSNIINPFFYHPIKRIDTMLEKINNIMNSNRVEIQRKRNNTLKFLEKAKTLSLEYQKKFDETIKLRDSF